jgi:hypothetical protein
MLSSLIGSQDLLSGDTLPSTNISEKPISSGTTAACSSRASSCFSVFSSLSTARGCIKCSRRAGKRGDPIVLFSSLYQLNSDILKKLWFLISSQPFAPSRFFGSSLSKSLIKSLSYLLRFMLCHLRFFSLASITILKISSSTICSNLKGGQKLESS